MELPNTKRVLLEIRGLKTYFSTNRGLVRAVDGADFTVHEREVLGLVGESGCGKSTTGLSIMRLLNWRARVEGEIIFNGQNLLKTDETEMERIRGNRISMIFQEPKSSLNPVHKVGHQIGEALAMHQGYARQASWKRAIELLRVVGISDGERRAHAYPHEMSDGMAQRVMIAMALACEPALFIADEPTTALDVTIQAQILDLLRGLRSRMGTSVILITHDLGVVAEMADRVAVMYAGRIVEEADVKTLFADPRHPYTRGLIGCIPVLGQVKDELELIPGSVCNPINLPPGCRFAPRCQERVKYNLSVCIEDDPEPQMVGSAHTVRCWLYKSRGGRTSP